MLLAVNSTKEVLNSSSKNEALVKRRVPLILILDPTEEERIKVPEELSNAPCASRRFIVKKLVEPVTGPPAPGEVGARRYSLPSASLK